MAAKAAPSALVVATRATDGGCGAGNGDATFALQGGHRARRPTGTEDSHTYNVPRHQKTPPPGKRPGFQPEPEPQGGAATVGYVAAPEPLLVVPSMASGDSVDGITLNFLLKVTLAWKQKEEEAEERKKQEKQRKREQEEERRQAVQALTDLFNSGALSSSSRRRKKKRTKRLLRTAWFYSGYMFMPRSWRLFWTNSTQLQREGGARAVRTWKPGLSTSHRYLAPTCSVPVTPEEHRKIWSFLGDDYAELSLRPIASASHWCGALLVFRLKSTGMRSFLGDPFRKRSRILCYLVRQ